MATKYAPTINRPRNKFKMPHEVATTFDGGLVIPLDWQEILPGDHLAKKMSYIVRMMTPLRPVMDNAYLNVSAYFVPYEIIWNQFKQFMGQNETSAWTNNNAYLVPAITSATSAGNFGVGTIGDYLGLPTSQPIPAGTRISLLPLRGYLACWNFWYRNQNVVDPILYTKESTDWSSASYGKGYGDFPLPSMKLPDYFTTCLPQPSKISAQVSERFPVVTGTEHATSTSGTALKGQALNAAGAAVGPTDIKLTMANNSGGSVTASTTNGSYNFAPTNLWAETTVSIENIRRAAVYQHIGEILARGGSRYASEFLVNIFGVKNSESLFDEPEFLGSIDRLINMTEVTSNADTLDPNADIQDPSAMLQGRGLGSNGAYSKTTGSDYLFEHTFTRHGMVFVLATVRHRETYFQGLEKKWTRSEFFDFYLPQAQGLGYQKVLKKEIYLSGTQATDNATFGYQDYGAEYRFQPNRLTGLMKPNLQHGFKDWTYAQILGASPTLNPAFMAADKTGFDRTSALDSDAYPNQQFFGNFLFDDEWIRVVGVQRFPGLDVI